MVDPDRLVNAEPFAGLEADELSLVAAIGTLVARPAGEVLFTLGGVTDSLWVVTRGLVELTFPLVVMGERTEISMEVCGRGQVVGWSALVPPHRLTMGGRVAEDARLASFDRTQLLSLCEQQPQLAVRLITNLAAVVGRRLQRAQALWVRELQRSVMEQSQ